METKPIKRLPYGVSNYRQVVEENLYFVDKTMYLDKLEEAGHFLFVVRPRRFGKSLLVSMMRCYYDINRADDFDTLFGHTYVGTHPTPFRNKFAVLTLDFSKVGGTAQTVEEKFGSYFCAALDDFAKEYAAHFDAGFVQDVCAQPTYATKLQYIINNAERKQLPLYLIIDEYDNFTNNVLNNEGEEVYHAITHAEGFYRDVFKQFKGTFRRVLMIGVSPVTMDDLTSGYNIALALTLDRRFNEMLGLGESEVRAMLDYYREAGRLQASTDDMLADMRPWYDGYRFNERCKEHVYNTDMVLYYVQHRLITDEPPKEMIDPNAKTDYAKLDRLIRLDRLDGDRKGVLTEIAQNGYTLGTIASSFPANQLTDPEMFKSLLFYYGMLTIAEEEDGLVKLTIPNNNVRKQYYEYLLREYRGIHTMVFSQLLNAFRLAAYHGDWHDMMHHICRQYHDTTAVRSLIEGERNLQGFMNAYLTLCPYYLTCPEVELQHGYCDFFLLPDHLRYPGVRHSYIIELKYLPTNATDDAATEQWAAATAQIKRYAGGNRVTALAQGTELHLLVAQIKGYDTIRIDEIK